MGIDVPHYAATPSRSLAALAAFATRLAESTFSAGEIVPAQHLPDGTIQIGYSALSEEAEAFVSVLYQHGWIQPIDWAEWLRTEEAERLVQDRVYLMSAQSDQLSRLTTAIVRGDRFSDGLLLTHFERGLMAAIAARAAALLNETPDT
jgi:hypothetical protein